MKLLQFYFYYQEVAEFTNILDVLKLVKNFIEFILTFKKKIDALTFGCL